MRPFATCSRAPFTLACSAPACKYQGSSKRTPVERSIVRRAVLLKNTNGGKSMPSIVKRRARATTRALAGALIAGAALGAAAGSAGAQTYGFATLQPGTLNHTTASAVAKVLKEKAGLNV